MDTRDPRRRRSRCSLCSFSLSHHYHHHSHIPRQAQRARRARRRLACFEKMMEGLVEPGVGTQRARAPSCSPVRPSKIPRLRSEQVPRLSSLDLSLVVDRRAGTPVPVSSSSLHNLRYTPTSPLSAHLPPSPSPSPGHRRRTGLLQQHPSHRTPENSPGARANLHRSVSILSPAVPRDRASPMGVFLLIMATVYMGPFLCIVLSHFSLLSER